MAGAVWVFFGVGRGPPAAPRTDDLHEYRVTIVFPLKSHEKSTCFLLYIMSLEFISVDAEGRHAASARKRPAGVASFELSLKCSPKKASTA
jgi:hypothetical protein